MYREAHRQSIMVSRSTSAEHWGSRSTSAEQEDIVKELPKFCQHSRLRRLSHCVREELSEATTLIEPDGNDHKLATLLKSVEFAEACVATENVKKKLQQRKNCKSPHEAMHNAQKRESECAHSAKAQQHQKANAHTKNKNKSETRQKLHVHRTISRLSGVLELRMRPRASSASKCRRRPPAQKM